VISLTRWLRQQPKAEEARAQLEKSKAEQVNAHRLTSEVRDLHQENRITARVHRAMRGGPA
jgi:hypothetical protein